MVGDRETWKSDRAVIIIRQLLIEAKCEGKNYADRYPSRLFKNEN